MFDIGTGLNLLGTSAGMTFLFLYMRSMKNDIRETNRDVKETNRDVKDLKNGCFERHAKIERELGVREAELKSLHRRVDDVHEITHS